MNENHQKPTEQQGQKCSRCEYVPRPGEELYLTVCPNCWQTMCPMCGGYFDGQTACWGCGYGS